MAIIVVDRKKPYKVVIRFHSRQVSKSFLRKVDAQSWEREMLYKRDMGESLPGKNRKALPLYEFRERFLKEHAFHRQAESTQMLESGLFNSYVVPHLGGADMRRLKKTDFQKHFLLLAEKYKLKNGQINRIRQILSCMYARAIDWELIDSNPVAAVRKLPEIDYFKEEVVTYLTQDEVHKLLAWMQVNDTWLYPKVRVLLNCGLRFSEMCALRVSDVIRGPNGMHLQVSKTFCRFTKKEKNRTKSGKSRMLPLGPGMSAYLKELTTGKSSEALLLWSDFQECRHSTKFRKHLLGAMKGAGIRHVSIHSLRHTFAVHFLERGGQLYDLQKLLGHQSQRLTERYSHFSMAMSERTRGLVDHGDTSQVAAVDGTMSDRMLHKRCTNDESEVVIEARVELSS